MPSAFPPSLHPAHLPPGTEVGSWRVVGWAGRGVHGAVYRAVPLHSEHAPAVALKLAVHPRDPRFEREVALLSLTRHPSIPRLWDSGAWQAPDGTRYPFLAMEWVEGVPLYDWAQQHPASGPRVLQALAQLASALQALHAQGAVHRDVKGDNVLVRSSDHRAVLTDFGSGTYPSAALLTPPSFVHGTPAYRSPESGLFELNSLRDRSARYASLPADDLFALGVTGCRMLTGEYPEFADPTQDEHGTWHLDAVRPPASLLRVEPPLRDLVLRMLAVHPEERGTAAQLAEALERAAQPPVPESPPLRSEEAKERVAEASSRERDTAQRDTPRAHTWMGWPWLAMAAGLALVAWAWWAASEHSVEHSSIAQRGTPGTGQQDAGTAGLGEAAATASTTASPEPSIQEPLAEDTLPEPQPGQMRPNAKGRCPLKRQVVLNGVCWLPLDPEECEALGENGHGQLFKGRCYVPALSPKHPSTSHPTRKP